MGIADYIATCYEFTLLKASIVIWKNDAAIYEWDYNIGSYGTGQVDVTAISKICIVQTALDIGILFLYLNGGYLER